MQSRRNSSEDRHRELDRSSEGSGVGQGALDRVGRHREAIRRHGDEVADGFGGRQNHLTDDVLEVDQGEAVVADEGYCFVVRPRCFVETRAQTGEVLGGRHRDQRVRARLAYARELVSDHGSERRDDHVG
ncbi:MAG TPA: hypothetical protein VMZ22_04885 [Acidimicrobiales bacterium]|nr:hypothetical protein [Acidimicrobiales bacterium]